MQFEAKYRGINEIPGIQNCENCKTAEWEWKVRAKLGDNRAHDYIVKLAHRDEGWMAVCYTCRKNKFESVGTVTIRT
jgi:hypothetical protein